MNGDQMTTPYVNRIGTATPPNDVHEAFVQSAWERMGDARERRLFHRMVERSGIAHRYSDLEPAIGETGLVIEANGFYKVGERTPTAVRMQRYEALAPKLAMQAIDVLGLDDERERITHLVVGSCTGFVAPGLDQLIVKAAGLDPGVERTVVGFMGCYAAVNSLRLAYHFVRSTPSARVLVVNLELCTLHLQETEDLESTLAMLLFADGASATLVTADESGIALRDFRAAAIPGSAESITWRIGDQGFDMHLSGETPILLSQALRLELERNDDKGLLRGTRPADYDVWAVHAGGRSILDAVEHAFELGPKALDWSRGVLRDFGNMSSATLMFVLDRILRDARARPRPAEEGFAMAFGPGLAAESFRFTLVG